VRMLTADRVPGLLNWKVRSCGVAAVPTAVGGKLPGGFCSVTEKFGEVVPV